MAKTEGSVADKLEALHAEYYVRLFPIAERLCQGSPEIDPDDLVQEALLRLLERRAEVEERMRGVPLDGWLIKVMANYLTDLKRKVTSRQQAEDDPTVTRWAHGQEEIPPTYEGITPERFKWAIEKLPTKQRLTYLLCCQNLRNQEIAHKLGIPEKLVAKRLFDARQSLKKLLLPYVDEGVH